MPVCPDLLGELAAQSMPHIAQAFVVFGELAGGALERRLYIARKHVKGAAAAECFSLEELYVASFSSRMTVYKGMFVAPQLEENCRMPLDN